MSTPEELRQKHREDKLEGTEGKNTQTPALSKKEKRRRQQRSQLLAAMSIIVLVVISVALFFGYQSFQKAKSELPPDQVSLKVSTGGNTVEVKPYSACRYDEENCTQGTPAEIKVPERDNLTITIPKAVHDHPWALIRIYDDPAANTEEYYKANEKKELSLPLTTSLSSDSDPSSASERKEPGEKKDDQTKDARLVVVEISSALIGTYEGEEEPYQVTWSIAPQS